MGIGGITKGVKSVNKGLKYRDNGVKTKRRNGKFFLTFYILYVIILKYKKLS
jgi:hypothetical protein